MEVKYVSCITINTDASFHPKFKIGGYAFNIVCDFFSIKKSGVFKVNPLNPEQAEMMCMANALHTLLNQQDLPQTELIVINSDCLLSFQKVKLKSKDEIGRIVAKKLREVRRKTAFRTVVMPKFKFNHVKAHTNSLDERSLANKWCDKEARMWMRMAVKEIGETEKNNIHL